MQKAHLYEAISLLNRGIDDAVRRPEGSKKAPGVDKEIDRATTATLERARGQGNVRSLTDIKQATSEMPPAMSKDKTGSEKQVRLSMAKILLALAKRIRSERERNGVSQEDFAEDCGLHRTAIGLIERGKSIPRLDTLLLVSQGLGLTVSELLRGIEQ